MYNLTILQKNKITTVCIMSQKLIRLTCESNDGVFDGKFDQDIEIKKGSSIAFQSLTLERQASSFELKASNNDIQYAAKEIAAETQSATLDPFLYKAGDYPALMSDMTDKLNKGCNMLTQSQQMNLGWKAVVNETDDKVEIACRPSPFFPMTCVDATTEPGQTPDVFYLDGLFRDQGTIAEIVQGASIQGGTGRKTGVTAGIGALNESYMFLDKEFTASTGSLRVRIGACTPGNDDAPAFTIGLVDAEGLIKLKTGTIAYTDLVYAVQVDQANTLDPTKGGYSVITAKGSVATTPVAPFLKMGTIPGTIADGGTGDVFEIVRKRGLLQGVVHRSTGKTDLTESAELDPLSQVLYPAVFFHLDNTASPVRTNILTAIEVSLDPWQNYQQTGDTWTEYVKANPQRNMVKSGLGTLTLYNPQAIEIRLPFEPKLTFETDAIAKYLGFSEKTLVKNIGDTYLGLGAELIFPNDITLTNPASGLNNTLAQGFKLRAKNVFSNAVDGDSYLVETQTFTLDSYDSYGLSQAERNANSGGSRRNLLAAILVAEQEIPNSSNERVTYEPNTLDYIAIKNKSDIITRQLKMRLLSARYAPVSTAGLAAMTLLIKDPDHHMDC